MNGQQNMMQVQGNLTPQGSAVNRSYASQTMRTSHLSVQYNPSVRVETRPKSIQAKRAIAMAEPRGDRLSKRPGTVEAVIVPFSHDTVNSKPYFANFAEQQMRINATHSPYRFGNTYPCQQKLDGRYPQQHVSYGSSLVGQRMSVGAVANQQAVLVGNTPVMHQQGCNSNMNVWIQNKGCKPSICAQNQLLTKQLSSGPMQFYCAAVKTPAVTPRSTELSLPRPFVIPSEGPVVISAPANTINTNGSQSKDLGFVKKTEGAFRRKSSDVERHEKERKQLQETSKQRPVSITPTSDVETLVKEIKELRGIQQRLVITPPTGSDNDKPVQEIKQLQNVKQRRISKTPVFVQKEHTPKPNQDLQTPSRNELPSLSPKQPCFGVEDITIVNCYSLSDGDPSFWEGSTVDQAPVSSCVKTEPVEQSLFKRHRSIDSGISSPALSECSSETKKEWDFASCELAEKETKYPAAMVLEKNPAPNITEVVKPTANLESRENDDRPNEKQTAKTKELCAMGDSHTTPSKPSADKERLYQQLEEDKRLDQIQADVDELLNAGSMSELNRTSKRSSKNRRKRRKKQCSKTLANFKKSKATPTISHEVPAPVAASSGSGINDKTDEQNPVRDKKKSVARLTVAGSRPVRVDLVYRHYLNALQIKNGISTT